MQVLSLTFLFVFFPLFLCIYYAISLAKREYVLLFGSVLFALLGGVFPCVTLLLFGLVFYITGRFYQKKKLKFGRILEIVLIAGSVVTAGVFRIENLVSFGTLWLPLGMLFYLLQGFSFCEECRKGKLQEKVTVSEFALYMLYFPHRIMGPVTEYRVYRRMLKQARFDGEKFTNGMLRFFWGMMKKLVLAEKLSELFTGLLENTSVQYMTLTVWLVAFGKMLAIWLELSGYVDMALGLDNCLGLSAREQFSKSGFYPFGVSLCDKFNHGVNAWFFGSIYEPLKKKNKVFRFVGFLISWCCIGLFYGMEDTNLLCGALVGIWIILERKINPKKKHSVFQYGITGLFFIICSILLGTQNFSQAGALLQQMFWNGTLIPSNADLYILKNNWLVWIVATLITFIRPQKLYLAGKEKFHSVFYVYSVQILVGIVLLLICTIGLLLKQGTITMQFVL